LFWASHVLAVDHYDRELPFDPIGARGAAMGGAYPALTTDPTAIYHNPASLVWQVLNVGFGIQPYRWNDPFHSWWIHFYNKNTEMNIPVALILQGWSAPCVKGERRNVMIGLPIAYGFSPYTPAAIDLKFALERDENGVWIAGVPIDIGFLGQTKKGLTVSLVLRNFTIGANHLKTLQRRFDYGASYQMGFATICAATYLDTWYKLGDSKDRWHVGAELATSSQYTLRGGFIRIKNRSIVTGGFALKSPGGPFEIGYAVSYDRKFHDWKHFLQYTFIVQPLKTPWDSSVFK